MPDRWVTATKYHMANERTLIAWLHVSATLGVGAFAVNVLGTKKEGVHGSSGLGVVQSLLALALLLLAYHRFRRRRYLLTVHYQGSYGDLLPPLASGCVVIALLTTTLVGRLRSPRAGDPPSLKMPINTSALPPFLYVTFHGQSKPRAERTAGLAAVHRFSLRDYSYAGPVTNELVAPVKAPRGMMLINKMLIIADANPADSSLAIFSACGSPPPPPSAPLSAPPTLLPMRSFWGRARPERAEGLPRLFEHPYGLAATTAGDTLLLSSQNGGAVVQMGLKDGAMAVVQQAAPPRETRLSSGPLRGMAADGAGCVHVADKSGGRVLHYCPSDGPLVGETRIDRPIDIVIDRQLNLLYIGAIGASNEHGGHVQVFSLDKLHAPTRQMPLERKLAIRHKHMAHPAGLELYGDELLVLEQKSRSLLRFDARSGRFLGVPLAHLPDDPEQLLVVDDEC